MCEVFVKSFVMQRKVMFGIQFPNRLYLQFVDEIVIIIVTA